MRRLNTGSAKRRVQKNKRKIGKKRAAPSLTADLQKLAQRTRERDEALAQMAATAEALNVISRSTFDLQIVLTPMLVSGVRPKIASERLGHSKIGITLDLYSHVLPNMQADAAAIVDDALRAALNKRETKG